MYPSTEIPYDNCITVSQDYLRQKQNRPKMKITPTLEELRRHKNGKGDGGTVNDKRLHSDVVEASASDIEVRDAF